MKIKFNRFAILPVMCPRCHRYIWLDRCNEDSDDEVGNCTRFTPSKKYSEIYDALHLEIEQLSEQIMQPIKKEVENE